MSVKPIELSVRELFRDRDYIIPLYQRNYAWEEAQVIQLVQDIWDNSGDHNRKEYYIGTLVVHRRDVGGMIIYDTIDGQQRLTTLNILLSVLKNEFQQDVGSGHDSKLKFDSRKTSSDTLRMLARKTGKRSDAKRNAGMEQAYVDMGKKLKQLVREEKKSIAAFTAYMLDHVRILQVEVPHDTDLNHYFEIMNSRGEQLEKHEILKAELLDVLKKDKSSSAAFATIWESCSNMDKYVQYGFRKNIRDQLFAGNFKLSGSFDRVKNVINAEEKDKGGQKISFGNFLQKGAIREKTDENDIESPESTTYSSIINFSNFLLHVLRVYTQKDVTLDDKKLIPAFAECMPGSPDSRPDFVKGFALALLRCRYLYDQYIVKRETTPKGDSWSLKSFDAVTDSFKKTFEDEKKNRRAIMLLSMFHVSFPQIIYKQWLSGVLNYLFLKGTMIDPDNYIRYLEDLSKAFYFDKFCEEPLEYYDIIFKNKGQPRNTTIAEDMLHQGTDVQNFIFNRLDYLIWRSVVVDEEVKYDIRNINKFDFSFRSSVEHYYPQNPKTGSELDLLDEGVVDRFGNLCLISRSKNSELSNYSPMAKTEHYEKLGHVESLKQQLMMRQSHKWDQKAILKHEALMIELLTK